MDEIKQKIIKALDDHPDGIRAKKIAKIINEEDTRKINSILYSFSKEFEIDDDYKWKRRDKSYVEFEDEEDSASPLKNKSGKVFHYYNCNPQDRFTDDCVVRAVCTLMSIPWDVAMIELANSAIETGYMLNTPENYGQYLEYRGYKRHKQPTNNDGTKLKFKDFVKRFNGRAVVNCGKGHVTYVENNSAWDVWDVSNEIVGVYWSKE